jgi:hypothetical protein
MNAYPPQSLAEAGRRTRRSGAITLETALVLVALIFLILGMMDLGFAVLRYHMFSNAARHVARQAIVHGELAEELGAWGPETLEGTAGSDAGPDAQDPWSQICRATRSMLVGINPNDVQVRVAWIDGGNDPEIGHRVQVTLTSVYPTWATRALGVQPLTISATSTMDIAH